jgi:hypothetical protein
MEDIKSIRKRIQDTLISTTVVAGEANHPAAVRMLDDATKGEVAILQHLANSTQFSAGSTDGADSRITRQQMLDLCAMNKAENVRCGIHSEKLTMTPDDISDFVDRAAFQAYILKTTHDQATAQTAKTLVQADDPRGKQILSTLPTKNHGF